MAEFGTALPTDGISIGQIVLHDLRNVVNFAEGALKIVVANDAFLPPNIQAVLAVLNDALLAAQAELKVL
jgi:hypothetical protein